MKGKGEGEGKWVVEGGKARRNRSSPGSENTGTFSYISLLFKKKNNKYVTLIRF